MPKVGLAYENAIRELMETVEKNRYTVLDKLKIDAYITKEPVSFEQKGTGNHKTLKIGDVWGELFDCAWMNFTGKVPAKAKGKHVILLIDLNGEACVFDKDGNPYRGLTTKASVFDTTHGWPVKRVLDVIEKSKGNENINIWLDCACNDLFGNVQNNGAVDEAYIAIQNDNINALYYDLLVLEEISRIRDEKSAQVAQIKDAIYRVALIMREGTEEEAIEARKLLKPLLDRKNGDYPLTISYIGHAHIDLAWLWPVRETIRKGARTFSTVMRNMEKYPQYKFVQSQAQIYAWMKDNYPGLYKEIKNRVKEGRWEPNGSMWVEPDCNMPSGESFVRQFFYGKKYFMDEFGINTDVCFLPDTFGYSGALPQILKESEVDYFTTQKLSWNKVNKFPHQSFIWEGNDGSKVLAHMLPEENYLSSVMPRAIKFTEENYFEKDVTEYCLGLYGIGDGGGGPSEEHIELLARQNNLLGQAKTVEEKTSDFFKKLEKDKDKFGTWKGEMYLEYHQGTLTSQAKNKKYNRLMEFALRDSEILSSIAMLSGEKYPQEEIENIWKEVLLYQFHDVLPGSSIKRVYDESCAGYEKMLSETSKIMKNAQKVINKGVSTKGFNRPVLVSNTLPWDREEFIKVEDKWLKATAPSIGYKVVELEDAKYTAPKLTKNGFENSKLKVVFDPKNGALKSVYDKSAKRELLKNESNIFIIHSDTKDAWDMYPDYDLRHNDRVDFVEQEFSLDGPMAQVKQTYKFNKSIITQRIKLVSDSIRLDFDTEVDWHESEKQLRVHFDFDIFTDYARSEIQFGNIKRPNHTNTTWEVAKYETCAHKWIDLSERDYGVALLNNCKYGHRALGSTLSMNLLRSTSFPGVDADHGKHEIKYALFPHSGDYVDSMVVREGYNFNVPLSLEKIKKSDKGFSEKSFVSCSNPNVVIDTIKKADKDDSIIVRLYECHETTGYATLEFGFDIKEAKLVNLLEHDKDGEIKVKDNKVTVKVSPFKVVTLKINKN